MANDPEGLDEEGLGEQYQRLEQKIDELVKKTRDLKYKNVALEEIQSTIAQEKIMASGHKRRHPMRPKRNKELEAR